MKLVRGGRLIDENINKDVSELYFKLFRYDIEFEKNIKLRDLFELLNKDIDICSILFGEYFSDAIKDGLKPKKKRIKHKLEFDYLELGWYIETCKIHNSLEGSGMSYPEFYGLKKGNKQDHWALDLIPVHEIIDLPLVLNKKIRMIKMNKKSYTEEFYNGASFNLWQICLGISEELTFHGDSKDKEEVFNELQKRINSISK